MRRWSPRGVLSAALNSATYRLDSRKIDVPSDALLSSIFPSVPILRGISFEGIPNRDSVSYLKEYGLDDDLPSILRGTLRFPGFSRLVDVWKKCGLLDIEVMDVKLEKWDQFVDSCLEKVSGKKVLDAKMRREVVVGIVGDVEWVYEALSTLEQSVPSSKPNF